MSSSSRGKKSNKRQTTPPTPSVVSSSDDYEAKDSFLFGGAADQQFTSSLPGGVAPYHMQSPSTSIPSMPPPLEEPHYEASSASAVGDPSLSAQQGGVTLNTRSNPSALLSGSTSTYHPHGSTGSKTAIINDGPVIPHKKSLRKIPLEQREAALGAPTNDTRAPPPFQHKPPKALYSIELCTLTEQQEEDIQRRGGLSSLIFTKSQLDGMQRLFLVLDTESKGYISFHQVEAFVYSRCPVVRRRDQALALHLQQQQQHDQMHGSRTQETSGTLAEAWRAIVHSGLSMHQLAMLEQSQQGNDADFYLTQRTALGLEGWMILLRLISFCQYHEAKQFFSAKRVGSTMVVVDVPRDPSIIPLTMDYLLQFEQKFDYRKVLNGTHDLGKKTKAGDPAQAAPPQYCPPMPDLDLNHSGIAAQEDPQLLGGGGGSASIRLPAPTVQIGAMGSYSDAVWKAGKVDLTFTLTSTDVLRSRGLSSVGAAGAGLMSTSMECTTSTTTVRRSLEDLLWLNETFRVHKKLGGTLCGRILPPFLPDESGYSHHTTAVGSAMDMMNPSDKSSGSGSSSSVFSYVKSVGKSVLGTIQKTSGIPLTSTGASSSRKGSGEFGGLGQEARLKRLNRCTNYLLEHAGLQRSFPLNSFLKASKTGLEATKRIVEESTKSSSSASSRSSGNESTHQVSSSSQTAGVGGGERSGPTEHASINSGQHVEPSSYVSLNWIRNAAQAAVTLKVHGILNATGMSTYSARLQHASLPEFDYHQSYRGTSTQNLHPSHHAVAPKAVAAERNISEARPRAAPSHDEQNSPDQYESVVTSVECGLDDEYDLLPSPQKGGERGSFYEERDFAEAGERGPTSLEGTNLDSSDPESSINATIDRLRGVIVSVDDHLHRCIAAHDKIASASRARVDLHLTIIRALDTNSYGDADEGLNAALTMDEQYFLRGMTDMERSHEIQFHADSNFGEELSWQTSLSGSAVSAANDVRAATHAARRAAGAKRAAEAAAQSAQKSLEKLTESSIEPSEALDAAQVRHEKTRSHAMHAAIVAHETTTVKRKAAMALAHDVRQWSDHRRRELFKTCHVLSQLHCDAARSSAGAWAVLKQAVTGPMESESNYKAEESVVNKIERLSIQEEPNPNWSTGAMQADMNPSTGVPEVLVDDFYNTHTRSKDPFLSTTQSRALPPLESSGYDDPPFGQTDLAAPPLLSSPEGPPPEPFSFPPPLNDEASINLMPKPPTSSPLPQPMENEYQSEVALLGMEMPYSLDSEFHDFPPNQDLDGTAIGGGLLDDAFRQMGETPSASGGAIAPPTGAEYSYSDLFPVSTGVAPAPEDATVQKDMLANVEADEATTLEDSPWDTEFQQNESSLQEQSDGGTDKDDHVLTLVTSLDEFDDDDEPPTQSNATPEGSIHNEEQPSGSASAMQESSATASSTAGDGEGGGNDSDAMTASMQSLVDGLMAWGNRYDPTDDIAIPSGLVASILEEQEHHDQKGDGDDSTTMIE